MTQQATLKSSTRLSSPRKSRRWLWLAVAAIVLVGGFMTVPSLLRSRSSASSPTTAASGEIVTAFTGDLSSRATATGYVQASRDTRLSLQISGVVQTVSVAVGDTVQADDLLVQLDATALQRAVTNAELALQIQEANLQELLNGSSATDLASAQASVASAQANLDKVQAGANTNDIEAARASVAAAQAAYDDLLAGPDGDAVTQAEANLRNAEASVRQAQAAYDQVATLPHVGATQQSLNLEQATNSYNAAKAAYDQATAAPSDNQVQQSVANLEQAQANLKKLLETPSTADVSAAQSQLAQAQAQLDSLTTGASAEKISIAQAQVEQARLNLEEAQETLQKASLRAPYAGVVTAVYVAEGEQAAGVAVELADMAHLQVALAVDEVDVGVLAVDQPAVVTFETWPGDVITGTIQSIAPKATDNTSALVSYEVLVALASSNLPVRIGMTADADLVTAERQNVLLVPSKAITADREAGTYTVNRVTQDASGAQVITPVQVTIGMKDGGNTEITSGLAAGDAVLIGSITTAAEETGGFSLIPPRPEGSNSPFAR